MTEVIEGEAVEVVERQLPAVVQQPGQTLVSERAYSGPAEMVVMATSLADALKDIVERQKLYSVINGKKFPLVEAWMTIARMDNVVAREAQTPIRHDDGSYEGFVELIRLSDGMVIGGASALCGTADDKPWNSRSEPNRRSMAVTRATSRAFRQHYSWIMALAGYEATPAEEMVGAAEPAAPVHVEPTLIPLGEQTHTGRVAKGDGDHNDLEFHADPNGYKFGFKLVVGDGQSVPQVICTGALGTALLASGVSLLGQTVTVSGEAFRVEQPGRRAYRRLMVESIEGDGFKIPAGPYTVEPTDKVDDLDKLPF